MNQLPLFPERYSPSLLPTKPVYEDTLIMAILIIFAISALLWANSRRKTQHKNRGVTIALIAFCSLQTLFNIGLIYANTRQGGEANFWHDTTIGALGGLIYFVVFTLFYLLSWWLFTQSEGVIRWFQNYFEAWCILGFALYIPIIIAIGGWLSNDSFIYSISIIYLLYRITIIGSSLRVFQKLLKYPLHIILYLCTCEIAPVLFIFA